MHIAYAKNMVSHESVLMIIKQSYSDFSKFALRRLTEITRKMILNGGHSLKFYFVFHYKISDQKYSFIKDKCPVVK